MTSRESEVQEGPSGAKSRWLAPNARSKEYTYRRAFDEMLLLIFQQTLHRRTGPFEEGGNRPLVAREDLGMQGTKERRSVSASSDASESMTLTQRVYNKKQS
jgi:hypothetical protein